MEKIISRLKQGTSMLKWYDVASIKIGVFAFALLIAKYWPRILSVDWYWLVAILLASLISPCVSMSRKCNPKINKK